MSEVIGTVDCSGCVNREICGTHPSAGLFGCYEYCRDRCKDGCDFTCPNNEPMYSSRMLETGGYTLDGVGPFLPARLNAPTYVPVIIEKTDRVGPAELGYVAIPLVQLFRRTGPDAIGPIATTPEGLRQRLGLSPTTRIVGNGVGPDAGLEWLWYHHRTVPLAMWLSDMGVEAITAPNFSHFAFGPRDHFLWNRKRMYLFCQELAKEGFPVIPHLYGDSVFDWSMSAQVYRENRMLDAFTVEFQTGDGAVDRRQEMLGYLRQFRDAVGRPLTLIAVGARHLTEVLAEIFPSLVIVESSAYMKSVHRQLAERKANGGLEYSTLLSEEPIDGLLQHNCRVIREWIEAAAARGRAHTAKTQIALVQPSIPPEPEILSNL